MKDVLGTHNGILNRRQSRFDTPAWHTFASFGLSCAARLLAEVRVIRLARVAMLAVTCLTLFALLATAVAQQIPPSMYQQMRWRMIGPFRGGRTRAATGVPGQPNVFYIGEGDGGVWKSDDYGRTWNPIFDGQPTQSIGAIAVAASGPNIIYVGSGEGLHRPDLSVGDGVYKSTDGGRTWTNVGLRDSQQIPALRSEEHTSE